MLVRHTFTSFKGGSVTISGWFPYNIRCWNEVLPVTPNDAIALQDGGSHLSNHDEIWNDSSIDSEDDFPHSFDDDYGKLF